MFLNAFFSFVVRFSLAALINISFLALLAAWLSFVVLPLFPLSGVKVSSFDVYLSFWRVTYARNNTGSINIPRYGEIVRFVSPDSLAKTVMLSFRCERDGMLCSLLDDLIESSIFMCVLGFCCCEKM